MKGRAAAANSDPLSIAVVTQYFWPESFRVNDLVSELSSRGHRIQVLTGQPNYPGGQFFDGYQGWRMSRERLGGVRVARVPLVRRGRGAGPRLIANYLSFAGSASVLGPPSIQGHVDVVLAFEPSPVTVALPALALARVKCAPALMWVQDLWPDILFSMGIAANGVSQRLVSLGSAVLHRRLDGLLLQSRAFETPLLSQGVSARRLHYVPNWAEDIFASAPAGGDVHDCDERPPGFVLLFAGNVGESQGLAVILDAAERLRGVPDLHWVILGEGRRWAWMREQVASRGLSDSVHLLGHRPAESMPAWFARADVLLATLRPEPVFELTIPSKLQAYLASGKPILAAINGEAARVVREAGAGLAVPAGNGKALAAAARQLYDTSPAGLATMGARGREYSAEHFGRSRIISRIEELMYQAILHSKERRRQGRRRNSDSDCHAKVPE